MCKARLLEGQAYMPADTILSQGDIADGLILTCRAYAMSETVTIDCDID
jgi:ring-1,2-phenylacetyl-CoA epoxidase subunit PaaE